ncbi:MAG: ISL3 family transposase [Verrucomicrobia bacterium]|nr:ISL3 family transposase [Verrucomicrobiota bacterium]
MAAGVGRLAGMSMDNELQKHYALLLGICSPWEVRTVELKLVDKKVEIGLGWQRGAAAKCPECGRECSIHDSAPERTWRHLDTMQFITVIRARTPRADCPEHGVKTMAVPWAAPQGRFTLHFERFAIEVLLACANVQAACGLLGIGWEAAHEIMKRAVARGLERRQLDQLRHLGMDEKSFKRGHSYITLLTDLEQSRVVEVVEDRTTEAAGKLWDSLSQEQKATVEAVAVDMWEPFIQTVRWQVPAADVVHDKFHVSKYLNEAVDKVRRQEHKELLAQGDETLKGSRQLWLYNPQNHSEEQATAFAALKDLNLKVARAWAAKELFTKFWQYQTEGWARRFFKDWFGWISRSRLKPMIAVARMLKRHLENLLTYLKHHITNAVTEGLNSKIQSIKSAARGFRNFKNYRTRILFFCGKLDLYPL